MNEDPAAGAHKPLPALSQGASFYLDLMRVIATQLVLIGHLRSIFISPTAFSTGGMGVFIFFILSGFLITLVVAKRWRRSGPQINDFLIDRVARIFTPYIPAVCFVALANIVFQIAQQPIHSSGTNHGIVAFVGNLLMLHDYPLMQLASHALPIQQFYPLAYNAAEPFWTIPVEFWTYVAFASFAYLLLRQERIRPFNVLLLTVAFPVVIWNSFAGGGGDLTELWIFGAIGGFLWIHTHIAGRQQILLGSIMIVVGLLGTAGRIADVGFQAYDLQWHTMATIAFFGGLMIMSEIERVPAWIMRPVLFFARYSYSLYLVHNTVLIIVSERLPGLGRTEGVVVATFAAHLLAYFWYLLFERHYHLVGRRLKALVARRGIAK